MRFLALLIILLATPVLAQAQDTLVIHSYHRGMAWTDALQDGIESVTRPQGLSLQVSYMDSKRYQSESYLQELLDIYRTKLRQETYQAIVVADDHALWLVNELAEEVGDTPVIMVGINDYSPGRHARLSKVAGVLDMTDPSDNIALALSVQPDLQHIYVLADNTYTGNAMWQGIADYIEAHPSTLTIHRLNQGSFNDIFAQAALLPEHSVLLYLSYYRDSEGRYQDSVSFIQTLVEVSAAPVYSPQRQLLDHGAVGGMVSGGVQKGQQVGALVLDVVQGKAIEFPLFVSNTGQAAFNHQALRKWGLIEPEGVTVLNKPLSWYERYNKELRIMTVVLVVMAAIIVFLGLFIRRLRKGESKLQQSRALFEGVFDQSFQFIGILDNGGKLLSGNQALQRLVGRAAMKYDRAIWRWHCWDQETAARLSQGFQAAWADQRIRMEVEIQSQEDGRRVLDLAMKRMPASVGDQEQLLFEARDVTSRHQMEEKLREREVSYRLLYEQQPVILLAIDNQARIQSVNQFAAELLGYDKRQLLGHKVTDFYYDTVPLPQQYIAGACDSEQQQVWRRQLRYRCADGRTVWIRETIRPTQSKLQLLLVGEDISSTRALEAELEYRANHDHLTDLYNRNFFEQRLEMVLQQARDHGTRHAMFYIDLDQFRVINDTAGHAAGDEALKQVALLLQDILPEQSVLSRLGGDEFAIILFHCDESEALALGEQILQLLDKAEFYWQNTRFSFSCSIGLRLIDDTAGSTQQVHAQADTACYAAKDEGRNRLHLYRPDDEELKRRELEMECVTQIRKALAEDRLELHAQQIVPLGGDQDAHHYEILVRLRDSNGEMVSPGLFMPAAERYHLAHLIDRYVVNATLDWLVAHPEAVAPLARCAINLSGQSMGNREFVDFLLEKIRTSGLPTGKICLEITETAAIGNLSEAINLFTQLKALGCLISLDDFGSGLSSFGYLKRMPVDIIKIDGMFVRDILEDEMDFAMVQAINGLAKKMGKQTVAEFVENEAILGRLETLGVDYAQGYLFGKPQPLASLVSQLHQRSATVL
ncbi:EAL domain-containing protein [Photobacterium atrarenae]|uniref:EAL domain-containing protein n=1 Tax=Photobacterium atrarenae TaxID=865757 RepID=A0ABY5GFT6_9GAMM|nr:EAL domain-containing protein [Photobacterium atrarenae]UTV27686.1 EAL domain-containing protein [Photobacterium atrarenae]